MADTLPPEAEVGFPLATVSQANAPADFRAVAHPVSPTRHIALYCVLALCLSGCGLKEAAEACEQRGGVPQLRDDTWNPRVVLTSVHCVFYDAEAKP